MVIFLVLDANDPAGMQLAADLHFFTSISVCICTLCVWRLANSDTVLNSQKVSIEKRVSTGTFMLYLYLIVVLPALNEIRNIQYKIHNDGLDVMIFFIHGNCPWLWGWPVKVCVCDRVTS